MSKLIDYLKWLMMSVICSPLIIGAWLFSFFIFWVFIVNCITKDNYLDELKDKYKAMKESEL